MSYIGCQPRPFRRSGGNFDRYSFKVITSDNVECRPVLEPFRAYVCVFASCISRSQDDGARIRMVVECTCAALHRRDDTVQLDAIPHGGQISMLMYM